MDLADAQIQGREPRTALETVAELRGRAETYAAFGQKLEGLDQRIVAARVRTAIGRLEEARRLLEAAHEDAEQGGVWLARAEAELALGELELASGATADTSARLTALEEQARERGLALIARRAQEVRAAGAP